MDGSVLIVDLFQPQKCHVLRNHTSPVQVLASTPVISSPNEYFLLSGSYASRISLWKNHNLVRTYSDLHTSEINDLQFCGFDSEYFLTASSDGRINLLDYHKNKAIYQFDEHHGLPVSSLDASTRVDPNLVFSGGYDGSIKMLDLRTLKMKKFVSRIEGEVTSVLFHPQKNSVICSYGNGNVVCFDHRRISPSTQYFKWENESIHSNHRILHLVKLSNRFLSCGYDNYMNYLDYETGKVLYQVKQKSLGFGAFEFITESTGEDQDFPRFQVHRKTTRENINYIIDGKRNKIGVLLVELKKVREELTKIRHQVELFKNKIISSIKKEFFERLGSALKPFVTQLSEERKKLGEIRNEVSSFAKKQKKEMNFRFYQFTSHIFRKMVKKERKEYDELKTRKIKLLLEMRERYRKRMSIVLQSSKVLQFLVKQKEVLVMKFRKRGTRLRYTKSEFSSLRKRVEEVGFKIHDFHEKILEEYEKMLTGYCKGDDFISWRSCHITNKTVGMINNYQNQYLYVGELVKDGGVSTSGNGVLFVEKKKIGFGKRIRIGQSYQKVFEGEFKNNLREGRGIEYQDEKISFEGLFKNDEKCGRGIEYNGNKCIYGVWRNGKLVRDDTSSQESNSGKEIHFDMIHYEEIEEQLLESKEIGKGAYGTVYSIIYGGRECAVKIMDLKYMELHAKMQIRAYIRRSLRLIASFDHPSIIKVYGMIGGHQDKIGYIMEKCSHSVLEEMYEKNLSVKEKILVLFDTARGMEYLHSKNVMNRDLKWANVLIRSKVRKEVVITDFDTAKEDESIWKNSVQNTASSIGTPVFVAPEVLSKKYGLPIDVYSFGIMIHALLFDLPNPYSETKECPCGQKVNNITPYSFPYHIKNCDLRPVFSKKQRKWVEENEVLWLLELMKSCYSTNSLQRPTFKEIVSQMKNRLNNLVVEKKLRIIVGGLEFEEPETYVMLDTKYETCLEKIRRRWKGYKVLRMYYVPPKMTSSFHSYTKDDAMRMRSSLLDSGASGSRKKKSSGRRKKMFRPNNRKSPGDMIQLKDDSCFSDFMNRSACTTILVEFSEIPLTEEGRLKEELSKLGREHERDKRRRLSSHRERMEMIREEMRSGKKNFLVRKNELERRLYAANEKRIALIDRNKREKGFPCVMRFVSATKKDLIDAENDAVGKERFELFCGDKNVEICTSKKRGVRKTYNFDLVLGSNVSQEMAFSNTTEKMLLRIYNEKNFCRGLVFVCGGSRSGKLFTLCGPNEDHVSWTTSTDRGLIPRALDLLFELSERDAELYECKVRVSFVEAFRERVYDLLPKVNEKVETGLDMRQLKYLSTSLLSRLTLSYRGDKNRGFILNDVNEWTVSSTKEAMHLLELGRLSFPKRTEKPSGEDDSRARPTRRRDKPTKRDNVWRARGHTIFDINFSKTDKKTGSVSGGILRVVDLEERREGKRKFSISSSAEKIRQFVLDHLSNQKCEPKTILTELLWNDIVDILVKRVIVCCASDHSVRRFETYSTLDRWGGFTAFRDNK